LYFSAGCDFGEWEVADLGDRFGAEVYGEGEEEDEEERPFEGRGASRGQGEVQESHDFLSIAEALTKAIVRMDDSENPRHRLRNTKCDLYPLDHG
jgi:hypothetical protein